MTDTAEIHVIEGDVATTPLVRVDVPCSWCGIKLSAVPDNPVRYGHRIYHPTCLEAVMFTCA